jgi:hypothetical protein
MTVDTEAVADVATGAVVASTVEPQAGSAVQQVTSDHAACPNCGAALTGA